MTPTKKIVRKTCILFRLLDLHSRSDIIFPFLKTMTRQHKLYCQIKVNLIYNKGITWLFSGILFICARVVLFVARARSGRVANDTTRAQINNIPEKSHVIIIIINKQGRMISRMRVLLIRAKWITNSKSLQIIM